MTFIYHCILISLALSDFGSDPGPTRLWPDFTPRVGVRIFADSDPPDSDPATGSPTRPDFPQH